MRTLDVWYSRLDLAGIEQRWGAEAGADGGPQPAAMAAKAETKNHLKAFDRLTRVVDGELRFVSDPRSWCRCPSSSPTSTPRACGTRSATRSHDYRHTLTATGAA